VTSTTTTTTTVCWLCSRTHDFGAKSACPQRIHFGPPKCTPELGKALVLCKALATCRASCTMALMRSHIDIRQTSFAESVNLPKAIAFVAMILYHPPSLFIAARRSRRA
jgi:hypothetical protein